MSTTTPPVTAQPQTPEPSAASTPVSNKRTAATGAIPKQMQSWIFLAILGVVAIGLWFSSTGQKAKNANAAGPAAGSPARPIVGGLTPDEVQRRLAESEDARRAALANPPLNQPGLPSDAHLNPDTAYPGANPPGQASAPVRDPIEEDERKREYVGRFASSVALSYRAETHAANSAPQPPRALGSESNSEDIAAAAAAATSQAPALPANFQQQLEMLQAQQEKLLAQQQQIAATAALPAGPQAQPPKQAETASASSHKNADLNAATGKNHVVFEGTVLESVLVNRLNGDFAGPVICQTTNDLYSHDHSQLLIPAGTRVLGETKKISDAGQARLAVVFHRLIMPDGYAVDLDQASGLNQIGETALHDKVNNHYFKVFGSSIAVGAIAGLASVGASNSAVTGLPTSSTSAYREGVSGSLSQSSLRILDKFLNIPPTITIREGHRVRIFLTEDLLLPAYAQHKMPTDL
jgi:type IV secretory pathway VirB10-like protein